MLSEFDISALDITEYLKFIGIDWWCDKRWKILFIDFPWTWDLFCHEELGFEPLPSGFMGDGCTMKKYHRGVCVCHTPEKLKVAKPGFPIYKAI